MIVNTLGRYFAGRFVGASLAVFASIFVLIWLVDYIELLRRTSSLPTATGLIVVQIALFRVPFLLDRLMPFCVLIGAMSCYLALSRRMELVVARAAGVSAWQFMTPALISALFLGVLATTVYNPTSAAMQEMASKFESDLLAERAPGLQDAVGFWISQTTTEGQTIINAAVARNQGQNLTGLTAFRFDPEGKFMERFEARTAELQPGRWVFNNVRRYSLDSPSIEQPRFDLMTTLTSAQVRNTVVHPESVSFWQLPSFIRSSENSGLAAAAYKLQYQKLVSKPFFLAAMVMLAAAVSLRFFRFGGVQKMVLSGVGAGFLVYVLSKVTDDLSKAELMHPIAAAWLPACVGGLTGFMALLFQEDG